MSQPVVYRYQFNGDLKMPEVEATLVLAILATESIHGVPEVRLDVAHAMDVDRHLCVIDGSSAAGRDLNRLFTGFLYREFGPDSFRIERVETPQQGTPSC